VQLADITPLVLTFNEEPNLDRTLAGLAWARRVVVLDSGSTDRTLGICACYPNVAVITRPFDGHTSQWNFGLEQVTTPWVLTLDADYVLSGECVAELERISPGDRVAGYFGRFTYCVFGRPLRGSLYPPRLLLFRTSCGRYVDDGHTQRLNLSGEFSWLESRVCHDDRKPMDRWWRDQWRYAELETTHLLTTPTASLRRIDRLRRSTPLAPLLVFLYGLLYRGLILDGWPGWFYTAQRTAAELLLLLLLVDRRLRGPVQSTP